MNASGEELLLRRGIRIVEEDFPAPAFDPRHDGLILTRAAEGGAMLKVVIRRGVGAAQRAAFARWAETSIERFLAYGPDDEWETLSGGQRYLWFRRTTILGL